MGDSSASKTFPEPPPPMANAPRLIVEAEDLERLLEALRNREYQVIGPTIRDNALVHEELTSIRELPIGWTTEQEGGACRLKRRGDGAFFGYGVGQHSWKHFLFAPSERLWSAERTGAGFAFADEPKDAPQRAFLGVRSCDLWAIAIQDHILMRGPYISPAYKARREAAFLVAVNCAAPGGVCFCASMKTGPRATGGFDLALTEVLEAGRHFFLVETGTENGAEVLRDVPRREARPEELQSADRTLAESEMRMGRALDTEDIKGMLYNSYEHPRWEDVAQRCLTCANCTFVCPTCFCSTLDDGTDLSGQRAQRWQKWDSCFTMDYSYISGGVVRRTPMSRYRQWMIHKLATWIDQFGVSGCVGCGRCIVWCPVGIDITEEARAIRESARAQAPNSVAKEG